MGKILYYIKKLHIELKLVTDIKSFFHGLMQETYFFIYFNPINFDDLSFIITNIYLVIENIITFEYDIEKLEKIENILVLQHNLLLSENSEDFINQYAPYTFEKKRNFLLFKKTPISLLKNKISKLAQYFKHKYSTINAILPYHYDSQLVHNEITESTLIVNNIDNEKNDNELLEKDELVNLALLKQDRKEKIDKIYNSNLLIKKNHLPRYVQFLSYKEISFSNNLKAIFINDKEKNEIIVLVLSLKIKHYYDNDKYLGGIAFLFDWLYEGTLNFKGTKFIETIEKYGIEFSVNIGTIEIRCLKKYISIAMNLLSDFLQNPEFSVDRFDLLKKQTIDNIKNFMDDAFSVGLQKIRELIYQNHPYAKNPSGNIDTINILTPDIVKELYHKYITPDDALLFIVGNITEKEIADLIEIYLLSWEYKKIEKLELIPVPKNFSCHTEYVNIDKEQVVIFYGGLSVKKYTEEFYYLLLADQLLSGSITDSMHAVLFQIRDKLGIFYDISGSLVSGCSDNEGMILIKAMTDKNSVNKAVKNINNVINNFISFLTKEDILIAKKSLLLAMAEKNDSKSSILNCFLNKYRYNLSEEDFKNNYNIIKNASLKNIKNTLKLYFKKNQIKILIVGDFK